MRLKVPSSKSLTQRAIFIASLIPEESIILDHLECDDSFYLKEALKKLGVKFKKENNKLKVIGRKRFKEPNSPLYVGNGGTTARFLTALSLTMDFEYTLDGSPEIYRRPYPGLFNLLSSLGIRFHFHRERYCLPVTIYPNRDLNLPDKLEIDSNRSSQQLSSLLMVLPIFKKEIEVEVKGKLPSKPYIDLTLYVMERFGVKVKRRKYEKFYIPNESYRASEIHIEGDWSSSAFLISASYLLNKKIEIENLNPNSLQGDRVFPELLKRLPKSGERVEIDMEMTPDLVPPLVATALFSNGITVLKNIEHLRIKESDRIRVLSRELNKAGFKIEEEKDKLIIYGGGYYTPKKEIYLDPEKDHRMALCFAIVSLKANWIKIKDRGCVTKSFPNFWELFERIKKG